MLHFCRHLPEFGWEAEVLTVSNGGMGTYDEELLSLLPPGVKVHRAFSLEWPIRQDRSRRPPLTPPSTAPPGDAPGQARRWGKHLKKWVQDHILIPDEKVGWVPFAARLGARRLREGGISAILTSGPPLSGHLAGVPLRRRFPVAWLADFRDPWTLNPYQTQHSGIRLRIEQKMESAVFRTCDAILANTETAGGLLTSHFPQHSAKVTVLGNGFDPTEFPSIPSLHNPRMVLTHSGNFYQERSPLPLLAAVDRLLRSRPELRRELLIRFVGGMDPINRQRIEEACCESPLRDVLAIEPFVSYSENRDRIASSDALLLITDPGEGGRLQVPAKLFEYMAASRPILAIVPPGAAADIVRRTRTGAVVEPADVESIQFALLDHLQRFRQGSLRVEPDLAQLQTYEISDIVRRLAALLDQKFQMVGNGTRNRPV